MEIFVSKKYLVQDIHKNYVRLLIFQNLRKRIKKELNYYDL